MDNQVVVSDYAAMDRVLREERQYLLNIVKQIKKSGCNVLLVQKSILRSVTRRRPRTAGNWFLSVATEAVFVLIAVQTN